MQALSNANFPASCAAAPFAGSRALWSALLDEIDFGVVVCTADGAFVLANWAGRQELASGRWLRQQQGHIAAADAAVLTAAFAAARRGRRQLLALRSGDEQLFVSASPLVAEDGEVQVLLLLGRRAPCSRLSLELLAGSHGLTDAERRVLAGLVARRSPTELAREHGVALCTVRTQVKSLHGKLGVNQHGQLLTLLAGLPQLASALRVMAATAGAEAGTALRAA